MSDSSIKDFEAAIAELESIVKKLEEGDLALEKSLALYERGVQLSRFCHARLEDAERRIELLTDRGELKPAPASLAVVGGSAFDESAVPVLTAREAKGLEFDHVVVVEPAAIVDEGGDSGLRELYVALTRPTKTLTVVHARPLSEPLGSVAAQSGDSHG